MGNDVTCGAVYPTLAVQNVKATCEWYVEKLGFSVRFLWGDPPTHGAVMLDQACVHFWEYEPQLGENWIYFDIDNLDAMYDRARHSGVTIEKEPQNYEWGMREFNLVDLNGYRIRFGQNIE